MGLAPFNISAHAEPQTCFRVVLEDTIDAVDFRAKNHFHRPYLSPLIEYSFKIQW